MAQFVVPSLSLAKTKYDVDPEVPSCTCPAFEHSGRKRWCKHLTFVTTRPDMYASSEDDGPPEQMLSEALPGLFTVGHSNHSIEDFLALLERYHIRAVIDVRSSPYSRLSPHFGRERLRASIRAEGIDYFWAGKELGGRGAIPVESAAFLGHMKQVVEMAGRTRVALMCSEGNPAECHRGMKLTAWLHRNTNRSAMHILRSGELVNSESMEAKMGEEWLWVDYGGKRGQ